MENIDENANASILIPTDFSEVCENAVLHGLEIAKYFKYKVGILHVINKDTKSYLKRENIEMDSLENQLEKISKEYQAKFNVEVEYILKKGNIFEKISQTAQEINSKLIILGTHGKVGFQRLTGSYAQKVISSAQIPTIVVQKRSIKEGYKHIVFPVTTATQDRQKVNWAIAIAQTFNATIHIIPKFESEKYLKKQIMSVTKQIKNIFDKYGISHIDKVSDEFGGNFAKQVIDYAVVNNADLIMIMSTTDQSLAVFDSWDEQIMFNSSQIPVICINPVKVKKARFGW